MVYAWAMRSLVLVFLLLISLPLLAKDVYRWTTPEGEVIYSDTYHPGADKIRVDAGSNKPAPAAAGPEAAADGQKGSTADGTYETFQIVQPENDATIRSNEGVVAVSLMLSPALTDGDVIQIFVDGNRLKGDLTTTQFTLNDLNRGTHSLQVKIVDAQGNTRSTAPSINFHLRKASIIKP